MLLSHFCNSLYIQYIQFRITQSFYKNSTGIVLYSLVKVSDLFRIYKGSGNPKARQGYIQQIIGTSI